MKVMGCHHVNKNWLYMRGANYSDSTRRNLVFWKSGCLGEVIIWIEEGLQGGFVTTKLLYGFKLYKIMW